MDIELITFEEIRSRAEIDLIGGIVEIPCANQILRGTIDDIYWWKRNRLRGIEWVDGTVWDAYTSSWIPVPNSFLQFDFESFEYFAGPYQMESGEIFFITRNVLYTVIFPVGLQPPDKPYEWRECAQLHCRFMGIAAPWRTST